MGEQLDDLADQLISECVAPVDDTVIAYRGVSRWTQTFEPLRLPEPSTHPARLREGGVYLITGGLGGIGLTLAEYLAQTTRAKLALLGRAALPEPAEWEQWLATHGADDPTSRKIRAIQAIQAHGAEVMTIGADVADPAQMERAIGQVYARFGALHGVIHAAGVPGGGMIQRKSLEQAAEVLKPKVYGTLVLHALLRDAQLDFFILCSSINAIIGGFGQIDYCAANAFLDAFAASKTSRRGTFVVALNWDRWQEIGMAVETQAPEEFRKIQGLPAGAAPHPLLDACILETAEKVVYRTDFAVARHWALAEHLIAGSPTVPGTTYLEMARAAFEQITRQRRATIRDVVFIAPLVVRAAETRETLTILEQSGDTYTFRIISRAGGEDDNTWSEHARGVIEAVDQTAPKQHDLAPILARCRPIAVDSLTNGVEHNGSAFLEAGPRWQTLRQVARGADEGIAVLSLDDSFAADLERYVLHPALLDVAAGAVKYLGEGNYLPLAYEQVYVSGALPATIYSHIIYRAGGHTTKETLTCDILITDERGQELVAVKGFSMKRLSAEMIATLRRAADALPPQRSDTTPTDRPIAQASTANLLDDGIRPQEGVQAFARVLSGVAAPQLIISPRDIHATIKEAQAFTRSQIIERLEQIDIPRTMHARPNLANPYIAPSNDTERRIAEIWQRMLGIEQVGVHDNFFELGGTSLSAIQILAELKKALNVDIPAVSIFEAPTVSLLAAYVLVQNQPASFDHAVDRAKKKDAALARQRRAREVNR
jgi:polyketide synthase PksJ